MKVAWSDPRCIICLSVPSTDAPMTQRTDAHVIPKSIGGKLSALNLCKRCNSDMGKTEALLAQDVSVRLLVDQLEDRLPAEVTQAVRYRQSFFTDHEVFGRVEAGMDKQAELRPKESATIKGDANTLKQALAELDRLGVSEERKQKLREEFEQAGPGEWINVRPGYRLQRLIGWTDVRFKPSLTDPIVPLHVPVGIAYLYLALCLRERAYAAELDSVRSALKEAMAGNTHAADAYCPANRCGTRIVEPAHLVRAKTDDDAVQVNVQLFRDLAWPIRFPGIKLAGEQTLYVLDVEHGTEMWATKVA
jgi:HNH endonuclease